MTSALLGIGAALVCIVVVCVETAIWKLFS
jgi:hypothetical protein